MLGYDNQRFAGSVYPMKDNRLASGVSRTIERELVQLEVDQARINVRRHELQVEAAREDLGRAARPQEAPESWPDLALAEREIELDSARLDLRRIELGQRMRACSERETGGKEVDRVVRAGTAYAEGMGPADFDQRQGTADQ